MEGKRKLLNDSLYTDRRRELRRKPTRAEAIVWKMVRNRRLGCKFRRQYGIGPYVVDFCAPEIKLVIEADGASHTGEAAYQKDSVRQRYIEQCGFCVHRYTDEYIINHADGFYEELKRLCGTAPSPQPSP